MQAGPNRILQHFSDIWSEFIPESQYHTFQHGGYYVSDVVPGKIAVVALNTLYFFNQNAAVDGCTKEDEPGTDQMDWLEVELESLRMRKMTAYLTGHVPPARKSYSITCFARYTAIALKYQDVIVGHLYGHANIDHFFLLSQSSLAPEMMEEDCLDEEVEASVTKKQAQVSLRTQRRYEQDEDDEYGPFHTMGLSSYLLELWEQYEDIPRHAKLTDYAIVLVGPSVVPTYNPTLRVFSYQLAIEKDTSPTTPRIAMEEEEEEDLENNEEVDDMGKKKKKKKKPKKPKKPTRPTNPPAAPPITFGFPLNYTQYWMNLTAANIELKQPVYTVEYTSQEAYGMKDLSVTHFLDLARQIMKDANFKNTYLARMVVQTGTENDH